MTAETAVGKDVLRREIQKKYAEVADQPGGTFHFHTGRPLTKMLGYPEDILDRLPDALVESFAGVGNPFSVGTVAAGDAVMDVGSGSGFDCLVAAHYAGTQGSVVGVDMTPEMLHKADRNRRALGLDNVEFRLGYAEELPVDDASMDVVTSNGVINLCPDKGRVFEEIVRVLRPGGRMLLADIVTEKPVPQSARDDVDLWTG